MKKIFGIPWNEFLSVYWQKKPLLIRNAYPNWKNILSPEELAGLTLEEELESRLIITNKDFTKVTLEHGPLAESRYKKLPKKSWTILVQDVDKVQREVRKLFKNYEFVPHWRMDDVMISYAADLGGVGPHVDNYDVFLIQGLGKRRWQWGKKPIPVDKEKYKEGLELRILENFSYDFDETLEPGDVLYLPPRVAHHGVAIGECMTYSVGFRAPTHKEIIASYMQNLLENNEEFFYEKSSIPKNPWEISSKSVEEAFKTLQNLKHDKDLFQRSFGNLVTNSKFEAIKNSENFDSFLKKFKTSRLLKDCRSNFAFSGRYLFINGESFYVDQKLAKFLPKICEDEIESLKDKDLIQFLYHLYCEGHFYFDKVQR